MHVVVSVRVLASGLNLVSAFLKTEILLFEITVALSPRAFLPFFTLPPPLSTFL